MKKKVITVVKASKFFYYFYHLVGSLGANLLRIFTKTDDNLILFVSFGGKKFDDSPKAIYDRMILDKRFNKFEIVWAFSEPEKFSIPRGKKIKIDTLDYYKAALSARCWITNSTVERGLKFKGKNTFYFDTWHGTPIKKMGSDINANNKSFASKGNWEAIDIMAAQGTFDVNVFSRVFGIPESKFLLCGLPRNDILLNSSEQQQNEIKIKLGIPEDKQVILYAPTFREYDRDEQKNCIVMPPIDFDMWEKSLGDKYFILFRAHYEVAKVLNVKNSGFVMDVSSYPSLNELMIASDMLLSDYSSIFFDYSILNRPMICFAYDYDRYLSERGMYFDISKELIGGKINQEELLRLLEVFPYKVALDKTIKFRNKYVEIYGDASKKALDCIYKNINSHL